MTISKEAIESLAAALEPFAAVAEHDIGTDETATDFFAPMKEYNRAPRLLVGDLRLAKSALDTFKQEIAPALSTLPIAVEGKERVAKLTRYDPVCSASEPDMRPNVYGEYLYIDDVLTALSEPNKPDIDSGRFEEWSLSDIIGQCRMQSREQLDPEFAQFMAEVAKRLSALISSPGKDGGQEVEGTK